jgi:hypothetical protein
MHPFGFSIKTAVAELPKAAQRDKIEIMKKNNSALLKILPKFFNSLEEPIGKRIMSQYTSTGRKLQLQSELHLQSSTLKKNCVGRF